MDESENYVQGILSIKTEGDGNLIDLLESELKKKALELAMELGLEIEMESE